ncbi:hypothetical protein QAD02_012960 [Eretmocerus hayati]|uniref:Uncharacterized protein n=1 Tax=Eretmocerus hayati TaxID=131215 RepID=A0ACC2P234_9HYME|nr:hypothetical protein QAD02_012960 [Eretmocerus hayati]
MFPQSQDSNISGAVNGTIPKEFPDHNYNSNLKPTKRLIDSLLKENSENIESQSLVEQKKPTSLNPLGIFTSPWLPTQSQPPNSHSVQEDMMVDELSNMNNTPPPSTPNPISSSELPQDSSADDTRSVTSDSSTLTISHPIDMYPRNNFHFQLFSEFLIPPHNIHVKHIICWKAVG